MANCSFLQEDDERAIKEIKAEAQEARQKEGNMRAT